MGGPQPAPRRRRFVRLRLRAEDRRARRRADLRGWAAEDWGHARRRRARRGRDAEYPHHPQRAVDRAGHVRRGASAPAVRGPRRGLPAALRLRPPQRGAGAGGPAPLRQPAQHGGGGAAPARLARHRDPPARHLRLRAGLVGRRLDAAGALGGADPACRARLQAQPTRPPLRLHRGGRGLLPLVGGAERGPRLRDRRRRGQDRFVRDAGTARRRCPRPALGRGLQVPSRRSG